MIGFGVFPVCMYASGLGACCTGEQESRLNHMILLKHDDETMSS